MLKRLLATFVLLLTAAVFSSAVAHACPDLKFMQPMLQTPCDHNSAQDKKKQKENCDSARYGMLSTQASPFQADRFERHAILADGLLSSATLADIRPLFARPPISLLHGFGISSHSSHVVLRI